MNLEKLPSGSYRAQKVYKGVRYRITFDHKPTEKELTIAFAEKMQDTPGERGSFEKYATEYIQNRINVISPSTVRTYNTKIKQLSDGFKAKNLYDITGEDVQKEINEFSLTHEPKTAISLHGFIASVLGVYRPNFVLRTKLPQKLIKDRYLPSEDDIKAILNASKGTEDSIAIQLGILSLRRSEICALTIDDLQDNELHIHRNLVYNEHNKWVVKDTPKTDASNRKIYLPDSLVKEIQDQGYFFKYSPKKLNLHLQNYQKALNIPKFRFHDLRHYFASYAHSMGIPDADIMAIGGWQTDNVMKRVYRKALEESKKSSMEKLSKAIF